MNAKEVIAESFRDLIVNKGISYDKVAVYQICDNANVSRKTFYVHYKSKYDIVDQLVHEKLIRPLIQLSDVVMSMMENPELRTTFPTAVNEMIYKEISEDFEFYSRLCCKAGDIDSPLVEALIKNIRILNTEILSNLGMDDSDWRKEYVSYYFAAGNAVLIQRWLKDGQQVSASNLSKLFNDMSINYWMKLADL
ncbi:MULTISPECIES: TetR/AcrR family transcriptional regulator [unclassified Adlercreutzia]|uniref:TetR/AcrR family transcriptional regulator n=1 Tax=unclassified Adlercreutzia TaxID=2636013 RepID=UPI0013EBED8C|nr:MULTISPECIES: TetR/AcrR family transcriptional regulator [unclassified Adlercreutzia]